VLGLLREEGLGDEQGEVGVDVPRLLEHAVEAALHRLPDRISVRTDDHAPTDRRVVGHLRLQDDTRVPLGEGLGSGGDQLRHRRLRHGPAKATIHAARQGGGERTKR
jgi:hypothetical protein